MHILWIKAVYPHKTEKKTPLFSSVMLILPKFLAGFSGVAVDAIGYAGFFTATAAMGVPVLILVALAGVVRTRLEAGDKNAAQGGVDVKQ